MLLPSAAQPAAVTRTANVFRGVNRPAAAALTEFTRMKNLSSRDFPALSVRERRGLGEVISDSQGITVRDALCIAADGAVTLNGVAVAGLTLSPGRKQLVAMGAYELIFPDKLYFNTQDTTDSGSMEVSNSASGTVSAVLCTASGTQISPIVGAEPPNDPENGELWLDTSGETPLLRVYSSDATLWTEQESFVRISASWLGSGLSPHDGIALAGLTGTASHLNGSVVVADAGRDYITIRGALTASHTQQGGVTADRTVPDMDFVTECGNRLWGCFYGLKNGVPVNEIYASRLGDFKSFAAFEGLSTDSYAASRGADGCFTGAAVFAGQPIFFREDSMERVIPSESGAHRIVTEACRGVRQGCDRSLCAVGESLYWLSRDGVVRYRGASPELISGAVPAETWSDARGGVLGSRYYLSVREQEGGYALWCYDTVRDLWHREDCVKALGFAAKDGDLYWIDERTGRLTTARGTAGTQESAVDWEAETAELTASGAEHGRLVRLILRGELEPNASFSVAAQYDGGLFWHPLGSVSALTDGLRRFRIPFLPRRCGSLRLRLRGHGGLRLRDVTAVWERGSDV